MLEIKPVTIEDLPIIEKLGKLIWNHNFISLISQEQIDYMFARGYTYEAMKKEIESNKVSYIKLLDIKELIGFGAYGATNNTGEIQVYKLYIHPDHQYKGLVNNLLQYIENQAAQSHYKYLTLSVNKNNKAAISSYLKYGFAIEKSLVIDIGNGFVMDDYLMKKPVSR